MGPALQAGKRPGQGGTRGTLFCPHSLGSSEPACHEGLEGPSGEAMWGLLTVVSRTVLPGLLKRRDGVSELLPEVPSLALPGLETWQGPQARALS